MSSYKQFRMELLNCDVLQDERGPNESAPYQIGALYIALSCSVKHNCQLQHCMTVQNSSKVGIADCLCLDHADILAVK